MPVAIIHITLDPILSDKGSLLCTIEGTLSRKQYGAFCHVGRQQDQRTRLLFRKELSNALRVFRLNDIAYRVDPSLVLLDEEPLKEKKVRKLTPKVDLNEVFLRHHPFQKSSWLATTKYLALGGPWDAFRRFSEADATLSGRNVTNEDVGRFVRGLEAVGVDVVAAEEDHEDLELARKKAEEEAMRAKKAFSTAATGQKGGKSVVNGPAPTFLVEIHPLYPTKLHVTAEGSLQDHPQVQAAFAASPSDHDEDLGGRVVDRKKGWEYVANLTEASKNVRFYPAELSIAIFG